MALTAERGYETSGRTEMVRVKLTAPGTYYKGAMINITSAGGLAVLAGDVADQGSNTGIITETVVVAAGEEKYIDVEIGKIWIPFSSAAQSDVGDFVYAVDDDTIAKSATNADPCGKAVDFKSGYLLVDLRKGLPKTALA